MPEIITIEIGLTADQWRRVISELCERGSATIAAGGDATVLSELAHKINAHLETAR